ncbi:MAG: FecR domain-containing protein [Cytophagales bacterium]|nr:FecR domain-containing protein [Cytophagales bacterium]
MEQKPSYRPSSEAFAAYFSGELSSDEKRALEDWANTSSANKDELEQLRFVWQDLGALQLQDVTLDKELAFQKVKLKKESLTDSSMAFPIWRVAATVLLLITISWWFWKPTPEPVVYASSGIQKINLSDGSMVSLNDQAVLTYPEQFGDHERGLQLTGEAFFSVAEDKDRPFHIEASGVIITVLGTEFNVASLENIVVVSVSTGHVEVKSDFTTEILNAGDQITLNLNNESFTSGTNSASGIEFYWRDQKLTFDGVNLSEVLHDLKQVFDVEVNVSDEAILTCRLQANFEKQSLEEILEIIALSQNLEVSTDGAEYLLTGSGCDN